MCNWWVILFLFSSLLIFLYNYYFPAEVVCVITPNVSYTHIIVGAGTSGCVLAAVLSENENNSVLLIEAGGHFNVFSKIPVLATLLQKSVYDWSYETESQKWSSKGFLDKKQFLPRGKGLGGSGQMNFMIHQIATDENDSDMWKSIGAHNLKRNIIDFVQSFIVNSSTCNYHDYLFLPNKKEKSICKIDRYTNQMKYPIHLKKTESALSSVFQKAIAAMKHPGLRYSPCLSTIYQGQRWSTYYSHLLPASKRRNLHILCNTEVTQVIFKNKQAIGVIVSDSHNNKHIIHSESEIILSAGAINTPKLLLLSGIGNSSELQQLNIPVIVNAPGVGLNMQDHLNLPLYVSIKKPLSLTLRKVLSLTQLYNYFVYNKGLFATSPIAGTVHLGLNVSVLLFGMGSTDEELFRSIANYLPTTFKSVFPFHHNFSQEGCVLLAGCSEPKSRGFIKLKNNDPNSPPLIDPQYLHDKNDIICMKEAIKLASSILNTKEFKDIGAAIHWPRLEECKNDEINPNNDNYLECLIRTAAITAYHQVGTCKMGNHNDAYSVVDNEFRVKGVTGVRIVDSSILSSPLFTFPNAVLTEIAEYAAQIID